MLKQTLTITLAGKGETLDADSVVTAIESIISLLKSVDKNSWRVGTQRYKWNVTSASMQSPFTMTIEAIPRNADYADFDVVGATYDGLKSLDTDGTPQKMTIFDNASLSDARRLVSIYHDSITDIGIKASTRTREIHPTSRISGSVESLTAKQKPADYEKYGSVDGRLRQVTVDEREGHRATGLEIIDRLTDEVVKCRITPGQAERLGTYIRKRVVLYGIVRYRVDHVPTQIVVENFDPIDEAALPSLEDIHNAGISFAGGRDSADVIEEMRGHGD